MGDFGFGGNDVSLIYSDDDYDSYSNIFGNAKTTVTDADKDRLIASLKQMNENIDIEEVVNVEEVIRYFVVHNFAVNFDSYTGSMIHNYYLYEEDGKMEMIPWDYNLAFGTFQGGSDATSLVNYPIDTPVSGGDVSSRPMLAWIFESEEYTELYHEYFAEFLAMFYENGALEEMIDSVSEMIAPYIEKQPTEFYTYEEFQTGVATLKEFCSLRMESIEGQLNGTILATSSGQSADSSALIDGSHIKVSDLGSFGGGGGGFGGFGDFGGGRGGDSQSGDRNTSPSDKSFDGTENGNRNERPKTEKNNDNTTTKTPGDNILSSDVFEPNVQITSTAWKNTQTNDTQMPDMSQFGGGMGGFPGTGEMPDMSQFGGDMSNFPNMGDMELPEDFQGGNMPRGDMFGGNSSGNTTATTLLLLGISVLVLIGGLIFAILYGRKRL